jgi:hypothetical protein
MVLFLRWECILYSDFGMTMSSGPVLFHPTEWVVYLSFKV